MVLNVGRPGRLGALIGICAATVVAAAVVAQPPAQAQARVPWAQVGPGWVLAQYAGGAQSTHATTLYLISPGGTKYTTDTWRASKTNPPGLIAWSGDKTRALLYGQGPGRVEQLNLTTGKLSRFTLAGQASAIGYTYPDGLNILGVRESGGQWTLARYSLTGALTKVLSRGRFASTGLYSGNGTELAVPAATGLTLVSNAGPVIRQLPVPGTNPSNGCTPARWWNSDTILAYCIAKSSTLARLWLVPADGGKPTALTPVRKPASHDLGDLDAWRLSSGLYLQSAGACGSLDINKQASNGSLTAVSVPGTPGTQNVIMTADGSRLLIAVQNSCAGGASLLWFNSGNRAEQWLLRGPAGGFLIAVAYNSTENAPRL
jgi:hypothetical protein